MTSEVLGDWAHEMVLKFDLFACTPILLSLGILMGQHYGTADSKSNPFKELIRVPPLWALAVSYTHLDVYKRQIHCWAIGGIGLITLAMMARVSLGHTGRNIHTPPRSVVWICLLYTSRCV